MTQKVFTLNSSHREMLNGTVDPSNCPNPPDANCHCRSENSWDPGYTGVFKEGSYVGKNAGGTTVEFMNWRMLLPPGYSPTNPVKYPMIVMIHGAGEGGRVWSGNFNYTPTSIDYDNNGRVITNGGQEHRDAVARNSSLSNSFPGIVIFPQVSYNGAWESGWENGNQSDNTRMASSIIEYMIASQNVDPDRIVMHGLSNGAQGVWDLAAKRPDLFAAIAPMSGVGTNQAAQVDALVTTPVWIFQGSVDSNPNPSASLDWTNAMNNAGGNMIRTVYQGVGHGTWPIAYAEPNFFPWIKSRTKKDIYVFGGAASVCPGGQLKLGFSANFLAYQWTKDGVDISGATSRYYFATTGGVYTVKYQRRADSSWATSNPLTVSSSSSSAYTPVLTNTGSTYIPVNVTGTTPLPSVKNFVYLNAPAGFSSYQWYKDNVSGVPTLVTTTTSNQRLISQDAGIASDAGSYSVKTVSGCISNLSNKITLTWNSPQPTSPQPSKASATVLSSTSLNVTWTDYTGEIAYEIWRYRHALTYGEQNWTQVATLAANTTSYVDTGLRPGGFYKYTIRAILSNGSAICSPEGPDSWGVPSADGIPPTAPTNLIASNVTDSGLTLTWTASTDNDMVYKYEVYNGSTLLQTVTGNINGAPLPATTVDLTGLAPMTTYFLNVRALDFTGNYSPFAEGATVTTIAPVNGLTYKYYIYTGTMPGNGGAQLVEPRANNSFDFSQTPTTTGTVGTFSFDALTHQEDNFVYAFDGYLEIQTSGNYTFYTSSDDGSRLYVNGALVVNNDNAHGTQEIASNAIALNPGKYPIRCTFFEQGGGQVLTVSYAATAIGISKQIIPAPRLYKNGAIVNNYYTAASGALDDVNTWWSNSNGTGNHPANFTGAQTFYNVVNRSSAAITNAWTVSGNGSKVIVGSGTAITLDINAAYTGAMEAKALATINVNTSNRTGLWSARCKLNCEFQSRC
ncbi:MAG: PA14 domain-containing protein [Bacteroidota bacterium]